MILKCIVTIDFRVWLKCGKEIASQDVIERIYDENSEEYKKLCEEKENEIGFKRSDDIKGFDKEMMRLISEECKIVSDKRLSSIVGTFTDTILHDDVNGYVNIGRIVVNLSDVAAIEANDFNVRIIKE